MGMAADTYSEKRQVLGTEDSACRRDEKQRLISSWSFLSPQVDEAPLGAGLSASSGLTDFLSPGPLVEKGGGGWGGGPRRL